MGFGLCAGPSEPSQENHEGGRIVHRRRGEVCCGELRAHRGPEVSRDRPKRYRRPIIESQLDRLDKLRGFHAFTERRPEMSVELTPQIDDDLATVDAVVFVHERHAYHQQQN